MLALQVKDQYAGSSSDAAYRLAQHVASRSTSQTSASDWSEQSNTGGQSARSSPQDGGTSTPGSDTSSNAGKALQDLQATVITFLANIDENAPGSLRRSGAINRRNAAQQTMLHVATVMGYHRLVRRTSRHWRAPGPPGCQWIYRSGTRFTDGQDDMCESID